MRYLFIGICLTRLIGFIFSPILLVSSPVLLILLSPFLHHLVLTSALITPPLFLTVGILISIIQCMIGFEFGRSSGVSGLTWVKKFGFVSKRTIDKMTNWLRVSAALVLILIPGPVIATVAGITQLKSRLFYSIMIPAQIAWVTACYLLGVQLESYLVTAKAFILEHSLETTILLITIKFVLPRIVETLKIK